MKKFKFLKKEHGAITVMTAVMLTVLLGFTALSIDIGLHHYLGAKLQNAVDSAAVAVGSKLESNESDLEKCAYDYLAKNGYDVSGKYADKVKVDIDLKGVVDYESLNAINESEEYISQGYIKLTATVEDSTLFANALGISSLHLQKTAYVLVEPNYEGMPEALKYSIFAGAEMGDPDSSAEDGVVAYIDSNNPAMDIQGSTGAGSGETAFSSVIAVAENSINGVNTFVQNFKGWMNNTFGTSFKQDYNDLVSINLSEAVMNNDAHSNANIMIGVQALNTSRTKDNDYEGANPENDPDYNYIPALDDRYNGLTDADDYGQVTFSAVNDIDFGYSRYAHSRAAAATAAANSNNIFDAAGNAISWSLYNYLENQPEKTRVYVQNQQNVQTVQHVINILNEIDLDTVSASQLNSGSINDGAGEFELAAKRYFKENNAISTAMQNKVLEQETNLDASQINSHEISLNNQEAIVYRVNQKVAGQYLDEYAAIQVTEEDAEKRRISRLSILTGELASVGYDQMYKNNNSANGFVYQGFADKSGGAIGDNQTDTVVLERYVDSNGKSVDKSEKDATLKYKYTLKVNGNKVNRNTDKVNSSQFTNSSSTDDKNRTNLSSKYAVTRTFRENYDYIDMPNLKPYFTRQINQSVRDATKKREQHDDGVTTGAQNVKIAVNQAQNSLNEIKDEIDYTDNTFQDVSKYTNEYSQDLLFQTFKASADSGITTLTSTPQTLGGASMSKTSYKGYDLYNGGTLNNARYYIDEYDRHNKNNGWFGKGSVDAFANGMLFQNKEGTLEKNSVAEKRAEIKNEYGDDGPELNNSYRAKKLAVEQEINSVDKPTIENVEGVEGQINERDKVLGTPINLLDPRVFLGTGGNYDFTGQGANVKRDEFNTAVRTNQESNVTYAAVKDSDVALPNLNSPYSATNVAVTITKPQIKFSSNNRVMKNQNNNAVTNYLNSHQSDFSVPTFIDTIKNQYNWGSQKSIGSNDGLSRCNRDGGSNKNGSYHTSTAEYYWLNKYHPGTRRGFLSGVNRNILVNDYVWCGNDAGINVLENSMMLIRGYNVNSNGYAGDSSENIWVNTNGFCAINGNIWCENKSDSRIELASGAALIINGDVTAIKNIIVNSGAVLYINGNLTAKGDGDGNGVNNYGGTIIVDGTINATQNGIRNNSSDGVIYARDGIVANDYTGWGNHKDGNIINAAGAQMICAGTISADDRFENNGTMVAKNAIISTARSGKSITNNGILEATDSVAPTGTLINNANAEIKCAGTITCTVLNNNAGTIKSQTISTGSGAVNNSPSGSSGGNAEIRVNGNLNCGIINNNYSGNAAGSEAYIYVGGKTDCNTLNNYQKSYFFADGEIAPTSIENSATCQIVTNGNIRTGNINNQLGGWIGAKTTISGTNVNNYGGIYAGTDFTASSGLLTSDHTVMAGGNLNLYGTVTATNATLTAGGRILGTASITCTDMIGRLGITANNLTLNGIVKTDGGVTISNSLTVNAGGQLQAINKNNAIASGTNVLKAGTITNNNIIYVNGDLSVTNGVSSDANAFEFANYGDVICFGDLKVTGRFTNGVTDNRGATLRCRKSIRVGSADANNITVGAYLQNYGTMYVGMIAADGTPSGGTITVNGKVSNDELRSIRNYGTMYSTASINAASVLYSYGGNIQVLGDILACNSDNAGNNILEIKGSTTIYVRGCVSSTKNNRRIWMYSPDGNACPDTVLSILGNGAASGEDCFKNKLEAFANQQQGSYVFLGTNLYIGGAGSENDSWFANAGRLYVNGTISCPNLKSAWLTGGYDYGTGLASDPLTNYYVQDEYYKDTLTKYSALTYCADKFSAPQATINVGDKHYVYVDDNIIENYKDQTTPTVNLEVNKVAMWGDALLFAPNEATVTQTIDAGGNAIFNVCNKVNAEGTNTGESNAQIIAPIKVQDPREGEAYSLSGLSNVVFGSETQNRNITTSSLTGSSVDVKIYGDLVVNGPINLTNSRLLVTGNITCHSMTLNKSKVKIGTFNENLNCTSGGTLDIQTSGTGGAFTATNGSAVLVGKDLIKAGAINASNSTIFVTEGIRQNASSITLTNTAWLFARDDNSSYHDDNVSVSGAIDISGGSKLFVDGQLGTSQITVNDGSKLYGYSGISFSANNTMNIDTTTHSTYNSIVFCGDNTNDDVQYNLQVAGTLYMPPNKNFGRDNKLMTVAIKDTGVAVIDSPITSDWVEVGLSSAANGKATLYCAGLITIKNNATYTNWGRLYAYGGTDIANAHKGSGNISSGNETDFYLLKDNADTFLGKIYSNGTEQSTLNYTSYYEGHGDVFIDANLNINGYFYKKDDARMVDNRGTSLYIPNGTTYVSGNVTLPNDNAAYILTGAGLVCQKDYKMGCTIWNYGKMHIYGSFTMDNSATYITDNSDTTSNPAKGRTLKNGRWEGDTGASFLAWNYGNKGGTLTFKGYVRNAGTIKMNYGLSVEGYSGSDDDDLLSDFAFMNYAYANAQFAGEFQCNSNRFINKQGCSFGCDGRLSYGEIAYNCGQMYVGGDLRNNSIGSMRAAGKMRDDTGVIFNLNIPALGLKSSKTRSFALMNGLYKLAGSTSDDNGATMTWKDATLFVGGNMILGNKERVSTSDGAGSVINQGTMFTRGDFKVYGTGGNDGTDTGSVYYMTAIWAPNDSNTFIGGECYSGAAVATGKNSIFMVDGDLRARRPLKLNMWFRYYNTGGTAGNVISYFEDHQYESKFGASDNYKSCYMRVGGDVYANVEGMDLDNNWKAFGIGIGATSFAGDTVPYDSSRDIDVQANANILIGGSFYCPQKLYLKQNVSMIICGQGDGLYDDNGNLNWKCRALDEDSAYKDNPTIFGPGITDLLAGNIKNLTSRLTGKEYSLFAYQLLDVNIFSELVIHGNAYVRDTTKIRDMTKTYVYGDFDASNYLEIGKSLSESKEDATEAKLEKYRTASENAWITAKYNELRGKRQAGDSEYSGMSDSQLMSRAIEMFMNNGVYANSGYMYVQGSMASGNYTKIYASTTVRVGGNMNAKAITNGYITMRHDARLFVGGDMTASTSIDGGAYSEIYVGGNMKATLSNIKIRDQVTCYVGKNMTSPSYIELGKFDENYFRGVKQARAQQYLNEFEDAINRQDEQGTTEEGGEFNYNSDEHERPNDGTAAGAGNDNQGENIDSEGENNQLAVKEESVLRDDGKDKAIGSDFYVGGNILSYTSYLREYAYTRAVSGGVVVALSHITLQHNSDLWVLPEVFGNETYHETDFVYPDDWNATLWSTLTTAFNRIRHDLKQDFEPKPGSIYSLGQLNMNMNTSIFGTYDAMVFGQTMMRKGSLVFMGHDFDCWAPIYNLQADFSSFDGFMDSMRANLGLSENKTYKGFDSYDRSQRLYVDSNGVEHEANGNYTDGRGVRYSTYTDEGGVTHKVYTKPIVVYANNEINIATTAKIRFTYFIANRGDVNFTNLNFVSETSETTPSDATDLPNAFASYQGDVNFYALRGSIGALMYAPVGDVDLDGFAYDFYGSIIGDTVDINTFYINVHRFNNWRTMDLHIASSKKVYLIPQKDYDNAEANVDDVYMYGYDKNPNPNINEWAQPFFYGLPKDSATAVDGSGDGDGSYDDGFGNS